MTQNTTTRREEKGMILAGADGSPWFEFIDPDYKSEQNAFDWLTEMEELRLDPYRIRLESNKWICFGSSEYIVKVILDKVTLI